MVYQEIKNKFFGKAEKKLVFNFPIVLLGTLVMLIVALCVPLNNHSYGIIFFQGGLITILLLVFLYQNQIHKSIHVHIKWWHVLAVLMYIVSILIDIFVLNGSELTYIQLSKYTTISYMFTAVLLFGTLLWIIPRVMSGVLLNRCCDTNLITLLISIMVAMLIICISMIVESYGLNQEHALPVGMLIYLIMAILLFATGRRLVIYLNENNSGILTNVWADDMIIPKIPALPDIDNRQENMEIALKVEHELSVNKLYLNPNISLQLLSEKTQIPKHNLSRFFRNYYNKKFYHVIGEYRIRFAMETLQDNNTTSLDAISDLCGFNSKSTFYKYFKMLNGGTPNDFLLALNKESVENDRPQKSNR